MTLKNLEKIGILLLITLSVFLTITRKYDFTVWYQVTSYFDTKGEHKALRKTDISGLSEKELKSKGLLSVNIPEIFHAPRAFLCLPTIMLNKATNLGLHTLFNYQILLIIWLNLVLSYFLIHKTLDFSKKSKVLISLTYCAAYILMCLKVNGRITFIHLGASTLFYLFTRPDIKENFFKSLLFLFLSLWCFSTSSGTYLTAYLIIALSIIFNKQKSLNLAGLSVLILGSYHIFLGFKKNLGHYGGSIIKMASHGWGGYIVNNALLSLIILLASFFIIYKLLPSNKFIFFTKIKSMDDTRRTIYLYAIFSIGISFFGKLVFWGALLAYYIIFIEMLAAVLRKRKLLKPNIQV